MLHTIKEVEYLDGYKLKIYFNDKKVKIVDLEKLIKRGKNMFLQLVDLEYFKSVRCDGTTIYWPNGVDLCPDVLYAIGEKNSHRPKKIKKNSARSSIRRRTRSASKV